MALQVIGAGFGRTGTLSLKTALEQLGFGPCHHMTEVLADMDRQAPIWMRVAAGRERDWDAVFAGYNATVDWPGCRYYAELAEHFPEAKVILTVRDPQQWYASIKGTIFGAGGGWAARLALALARHPVRFARDIIIRQTFRNDTGEANAIATFERHNAEVRRRIPGERLLEFDVRQGWEPLCAFLGVPVPAASFPRSNDREAFKRHGEALRQKWGR